MAYSNDDGKVKRQRKCKIDREKLRQAVAEKPDAYLLRELAKQFDCTSQAVFYMLRKLGITLKKKSFAYREKSEEKRAEFACKLKRIPKGKRVYVDESGVNGPFQRENGRSSRGTKIHDVKSWKRSRRANVAAALCQGKHYALRALDERRLVRTVVRERLSSRVPHGQGYTVILDNASWP